MPFVKDLPPGELGQGGEGRESTQGDPRHPPADGGFHLSLRGAQNLS